MIKIKDNVDLKELEKFGFKLKFNNIIHTAYYVKPVNKQIQTQFLQNNTHDGQRQILENCDVIAIVKEKYNPCLDRHIFLIRSERCKDLEYPFSEIDKNDIQDLIQAGLVEKVGGER